MAARAVILQLEDEIENRGRRVAGRRPPKSTCSTAIGGAWASIPQQRTASCPLRAPAL
jgi:hypothetical protein